MFGDLAAAAIMGGGALGLVKKVMSSGSAHMSGTGAVANRWNTMIDGMQGLTNITSSGVASTGLGIMATGLGAWALNREYKAWSNDGENKTAGLAAMGVTLGIGALGAFVAHNSAFVQGMAPGAQPMASALGGAVLISALSAARMPAQQFFQDAQDAWKADPADPTTKFVSMGAGAVGGAYTGFKIAQSMVPASGLLGLPKPLVQIAGLGLGAVAGGAVGLGMSATMPDAGKVGIASGIGAAALGGLTFALTKDPKKAIKAGISGAIVGAAMSPMWGGKSTTVAAPQTPQDVAGTAS
jgi:hypothetical protein